VGGCAGNQTCNASGTFEACVCAMPDAASGVASAPYAVEATPISVVAGMKTLAGNGELQLKPWQEKMWCIPKIDAEFVARMEDVLALYAEPVERY
jgi:hypothetical protein